MSTPTTDHESGITYLSAFPEGLVADRVLDLQGETCPYPPVYTLDELGDMQPGQVLEVVLDNPPSVHTVPFYAAKNGHQMVTPPVRRGATYHLFFRVGGSA